MNENESKDICEFFKIAQKDKKTIRLFPKNGIGRIKGFVREVDHILGVVVIALKDDPKSPVIFYKIDNISGWMFDSGEN